MTKMPTIVLFLDADACPVKNEAYRVAERYHLKTFVVSNNYIRIPRANFLEAIIVQSGLDKADDWITEKADEASIVVTNDVPLANRIVKKGGVALSPTGRLFDASTIGAALATRNLMENLRESGAVTGGPRPFSNRDRSAFLGALELLIQRLKRKGYQTEFMAD
ncbi:YaiI/YqxD family protein [uncultured Bartonella sp.]|uniref:YaiI/YqxD family protein n=1 Tax=uncultured Bartonella sp. TaxID=104108 RepID=UPI0026096909|nr:YaiI/YqxD family protein [uncultured Bartonella sp.]